MAKKTIRGVKMATKTKKKTAKKAVKKNPKTTAVIKKDVVSKEIISDLVIQGDISKMSNENRLKYYMSLCKAYNLSPLTQPFDIITFRGGKTVLYANKTCAEQLRKNYGISIIDVNQTIENDIIVSTVKLQDSTGRIDMEIGAVPCKGLYGDAMANARMKSITKAKRRATLSMCGLGMLDETEIETIPNVNTTEISIESGEIKKPEYIPPPVKEEKPTYDIKKIIDRIESCQKVKQLVNVGESLRVVNFEKSDYTEIGKIYSRRMNELQKIEGVE